MMVHFAVSSVNLTVPATELFNLLAQFAHAVHDAGQAGEVEKINVPRAEMSTAGVIMAVNRLSAVGRSCIGASYSVSVLSFQGRAAKAGGPIRRGCALLASGFPQEIPCAAVLFQ
jgi:hypothetical protein